MQQPFNLVIYAPSCSGKTCFLTNLSEDTPHTFFDTDSLLKTFLGSGDNSDTRTTFLYNAHEYAGFVISTLMNSRLHHVILTNLPQVTLLARASLLILPSDLNIHAKRISENRDIPQHNARVSLGQARSYLAKYNRTGRVLNFNGDEMLNNYSEAIFSWIEKFKKGNK